MLAFFIRFMEIRGVIPIRPVKYAFLISFSPTRVSREVPDSFQVLGVAPKGTIRPNSTNRIKVWGRRDPRVVGVYPQRPDRAHPRTWGTRVHEIIDDALSDVAHRNTRSRRPVGMRNDALMNIHPPL